MAGNRFVHKQGPLIAVLLALTAGCGTDEAIDHMSSTTAAPTTTTGKTPASVQLTTPQAAKRLCDMIRPELSNWRVQGPTLSKPGLNLLVQQWAAESAGIGGGNLEILRDKSLVDTGTQTSCPDVRDQALQALEVPSLADALLGQ